MSSVPKYKCKFCNKTYKRKGYFQNHSLICEEIHKSKYLEEKEKELTDDIPTMRNMYYLLQTFIKKNVELEEKVERLTKYIETTKKRINILEWLNENIDLEIDYDDWLKSVIVSQDDLQTVFQSGIVDGINKILLHNLPCEKESIHPIKCFQQKPNTFYVYKDASWNVMDTKEINRLFTRIDQKLFKQFILWKEENKFKIENDDSFHQNVYLVNMHMILGGNSNCSSTISGEERNEKNKKRCKSHLYHYLKQNIKNIIQYEFTF